MRLCRCFFRCPRRVLVSCIFFFFFNDTATTEIYTLSLHDALPISRNCPASLLPARGKRCRTGSGDRKSTRLNSSHTVISYAVFCLKKKKKNNHVNLLKQNKTYKQIYHTH